MILGFAHPALVVPDLEKARLFYEKMFGFRVLSNEGWSKNDEVDRAIGIKGSASKGYMLAGHNCHLELFEFYSPKQTGPAPADLGPHEPGIRHLAFFVEDCHAEYRRLIELGGDVLGEPVNLGIDNYAVYCRDPFGNIIELCSVPSPDQDLRALPGVSRLGDYSG